LQFHGNCAEKRNIKDFKSSLTGTIPRGESLGEKRQVENAVHQAKVNYGS